MKRRVLLGTPLLPAGLALSARSAHARAAAKEKPKAAAASRPGAEVQIWNGKDLGGWVWVSRKPEIKLEEVWSVVDGALHCKGVPTGYIRTERQFTNFLLTLQVRHLKPGNGGVLLRVQPPDKVWPRSIEAQGQSGALGDIWNIDAFPMEVEAARTTGRQTVRQRPEVPERPMGSWNDYEIFLDGGDLTLKVNGVVQNTAKHCAVMPGAIALQSEGSEYEFRNLVLRPRPDHA